MATRRGGNGPDMISGTGGADNLFGNGGDDTLHGLGGHDMLKGGAGNDILWGGGGNDILWGEDGDDILHGGSGNDQLGGGAGTNQLYGGDGDDVLIWNPAAIHVNDHAQLAMSTLDGGSGTDTLRLVNDTVVTTLAYDPETYDFVPVTVNSGTLIYLDDTIPAFNGAHRTVLMGDPSWETQGVTSLGASIAGIERIEVSGGGPLTYYNATDQAMTVLGTSHADVFTGGIADEVLEGRGGGDTYMPGAGNDRIISAATGEDIFHFDFAGTGHDIITGWNAGDVLNVWGADPAALPTLSTGVGTTTFAWVDGLGAAHSVTVDATNLQAGQDYFFV